MWLANGREEVLNAMSFYPSQRLGMWLALVMTRQWPELGFYPSQRLGMWLAYPPSAYCQVSGKEAFFQGKLIYRVAKRTKYEPNFMTMK